MLPSVTLTVMPDAKLVPLMDKARAVPEATMPGGLILVMVAVAAEDESPPPPPQETNDKAAPNMMASLCKLRLSNVMV